MIHDSVSKDARESLVFTGAATRGLTPATLLKKALAQVLSFEFCEIF